MCERCGTRLPSADQPGSGGQHHLCSSCGFRVNVSLCFSAECSSSECFVVECSTCACFSVYESVNEDIKESDPYALFMREGLECRLFGCGLVSSSVPILSQAESVDGGGSLGNVFPLPMFGASPKRPTGSSRRVKQRYLRQLRRYEVGCRLISALNRWYGTAVGRLRSSRRRSRVRRRASGQWLGLLRDLHARLSRWSRILSDSGPSLGGFSQLGGDFYGSGATPVPGGAEGATVKLTCSNVSIPAPQGEKVELLPLL